MDALQGKKMLSAEELSSSNQNEQIDEFEKNLKEENLRIFRELRLKDLMVKVKSNDPAMWPFE